MYMHTRPLLAVYMLDLTEIYLYMILNAHFGCTSPDTEWQKHTGRDNRISAPA